MNDNKSNTNNCIVSLVSLKGLDAHVEPSFLRPFSDIYFTDESASGALMVLTADKLAGGPLLEYLEKTRNKKALRSHQFWEDAQRYLSPADDFGSFDKFHMAKTLVATYIAPDSPRQLPISRPIRDDLMRLLPVEKGDHLLTSVVDECTQVICWKNVFFSLC